jgi:hypothetical protein
MCKLYENAAAVHAQLINSVDVALNNDTYCSLSEPLNNLLSLLLLVSAASGLVNFLLLFPSLVCDQISTGRIINWLCH